MSRTARLQAAKQWLPSYRGDNLVGGYRKWFGVTEVCALLELRMLGVDIPDPRLEQARRDEQSRAPRRARQSEKHARAIEADGWDPDFAFIAGYTEGGAPYGIAWDDAAADEVREWHRLAEAAGIPPRGFDDDLPF